ncbi:MAG TPA: hypothetical protein VJA16_06375 [Thermoanaerobaculia bacterium]
MPVVLIEHTNSPGIAAFSLQSLEHFISGTSLVIFQHTDGHFFASMETRLAIDPQELRDRVNRLPFAEKLHLAQAAQVQHAAIASR